MKTCRHICWCIHTNPESESEHVYNIRFNLKKLLSLVEPHDCISVSHSCLLSVSPFILVSLTAVDSTTHPHNVTSHLLNDNNRNTYFNTLVSVWSSIMVNKQNSGMTIRHAKEQYGITVLALVSPRRTIIANMVASRQVLLVEEVCVGVFGWIQTSGLHRTSRLCEHVPRKSVSAEACPKPQFTPSPTGLRQAACRLPETSQENYP